MSLSKTFSTGLNYTLTNHTTTPDNVETVYPNNFNSVPSLDSSINTLFNINCSSYRISPSSLFAPNAYVDIFNSSGINCKLWSSYYSNTRSSYDSFSGFKNYFDTNYTFDHINLYTKTLTSLGNNGTCTWTNFRITYFYVPYILNIIEIENDSSKYGSFKINESNASENAFILSCTFTDGYRLKGYTINNTYIENNSSQSDITIDPTPYLIDNTCNIELTYEPIQFTANCYVVDRNKNISLNSTFIVTYDQDAFLPIKSPTFDYIFFGWLRISNIENNISNLQPLNTFGGYFDQTANDTTLCFNLNNSNYFKELSYYKFNYNIKTLTNQHNAIINFYCFEMPRCYKISYAWLDNLTNSKTCYNLPADHYTRYGFNSADIKTIPLFNKYTVENAHTKNWYYYDNNNELQTNTLTTISDINDHDIIFYARKSLASENGSYITWSPNNERWGIIDRYQTQPDDDYYDAEATVTVQAIPNIGFEFTQWNDGDTNPFKSETSGTTDRNYIATFKSKAYIGTKPLCGVYAGDQQVRAIYQGTTCIYGGVN